MTLKEQRDYMASLVKHFERNLSDSQRDVEFYSRKLAELDAQLAEETKTKGAGK